MMKLVNKIKKQLLNEVRDLNELRTYADPVKHVEGSESRVKKVASQTIAVKRRAESASYVKHPHVFGRFYLVREGDAGYFAFDLLEDMSATKHAREQELLLERANLALAQLTRIMDDCEFAYRFGVSEEVLAPLRYAWAENVFEIIGVNALEDDRLYIQDVYSIEDVARRFQELSTAFSHEANALVRRKYFAVIS